MFIHLGAQSYRVKSAYKKLRTTIIRDTDILWLLVTIVHDSRKLSFDLSISNSWKSLHRFFPLLVVEYDN